MPVFEFKHFSVQQDSEVHPVGTDSMILGALISSNKLVQHILDIGTGTGVLSLMCAQQFPLAQILGIDVDQKSTLLAQSNFLNSKYADQLSVQQASFLEFNPDDQFDLIISNPPFYEETYHSPHQHRNRQRNSENLPLSQLISHCKLFIRPQGQFWFIVPYRRKNETKDLIHQHQFVIQQEIVVHGKPNDPMRVIFNIGLETVEFKKETVFTIRDETGAYTDEYKALTKEFHNRAL